MKGYFAIDRKNETNDWKKYKCVILVGSKVAYSLYKLYHGAKYL
jgi:hypothetical protein